MKKKMLALCSALSIACIGLLFLVKPGIKVPEELEAASKEPFGMTVEDLPLKRGINISLLEEWDPVSFRLNSFIYDPETYADIKKQGFDHVRLPVNFHTYYKDGKLDRGFMDKLDKILTVILGSRLPVVLDFHGWHDINADVGANKEEFYDIWEKVAERYKDYPDGLLFEILNEPHEESGSDPLNAKRLNEIQPEAIKRIRKTNPTRILVASGPEWNAWWGLKDLKLPEDDPNIIIDVHTYQPMDFTHQGTERWEDPKAQVKQVRLYDGVFAEVDKVVNACRDYMESTGRKLWLGEFGLYLEIVDEGDVTEYLSYVTEKIEGIGMPWALWEYNRGCGAYDWRTNEWRENVLEGIFG